MRKKSTIRTTAISTSLLMLACQQETPTQPIDENALAKPAIAAPAPIPLSALGPEARRELKLSIDGKKLRHAEVCSGGTSKWSKSISCDDPFEPPDFSEYIRKIGPFIIVSLSDEIRYPLGRHVLESWREEERGDYSEKSRELVVLPNQENEGENTIRIERDYIDTSNLSGPLKRFARRWNSQHAILRSNRFRSVRNAADVDLGPDWPESPSNYLQGDQGTDSYLGASIVGGSRMIVSLAVEDKVFGHEGGRGSFPNRMTINTVMATGRELRATEFFETGSGWDSALVRLAFTPGQNEAGIGVAGSRDEARFPRNWRFGQNGFEVHLMSMQGSDWPSIPICIPFTELKKWLTPFGRSIMESFDKTDCSGHQDGPKFAGYITEAELAKIRAESPR